MNIQSINTIRGKAILCTTTLAVLLSATVQSYSNSLVSNSPFIPEDWLAPQKVEKKTKRTVRTQTKKPTKVAPLYLELKAVNDAVGSQKFYIYDSSKNKGNWVGFNDKDAPYYVSSYDGDSITVDIDGQERQISFKKTDGEPIAISGQRTSRTSRSSSRARSSSSRRRVVTRGN